MGIDELKDMNKIGVTRVFGKSSESVFNDKVALRFQKKLKKISHKIIPGGFQEGMIIEVSNRLSKIIELDDVTIRVALKEDKIKKDLTNRKMVKIYNMSNSKGSRSKYEIVVPIWGYPELGKITAVFEYTDNSLLGNPLLMEKKETILPEKPGIYIILKKLGHMNTIVCDNNLEMNHEEKYHLVLFKI